MLPDEITNAVVRGETRAIYDAESSRCIGEIDAHLHRLEDELAGEHRDIAVKAHGLLHKLSERLIDAEIAFARKTG